MLIAGKTGQFILLIVMTVLIIAFSWRAVGGKVPKIRNILGVAAIDEAIGRATEMGRPVHFTPGRSGLTDPAYGPQTMAGLTVLKYVSQVAAKYGTGMICTVAAQEVIPIAEEMIQSAYEAVGKPGLYKSDTVRFIPGATAAAYFVGVIGILAREKIGANIMVGGFLAPEGLAFAESGYVQGAIQIAGTAEPASLPFLVTICDYTLIGEEMYAAGAKLSEDPMQLGSIAGGDACKAIIAAMFLIGIILATFKIDWLTKLLNM